MFYSPDSASNKFDFQILPDYTAYAETIYRISVNLDSMEASFSTIQILFQNAQTLQISYQCVDLHLHSFVPQNISHVANVTILPHGYLKAPHIWTNGTTPLHNSALRQLVNSEILLTAFLIFELLFLQ